MARLTLLLIYNLLLPIGVLLMAPAALKKLKARGGNLRDLWQRFGFFKREQLEQLSALQKCGSLYWVHAASVGEVGIAGKLIKQWLMRESEATFVLTTTTPTGYAQALALKESTNGSVLPLFSLLDGWFSARRFLRAIKPSMLVLVEAEVWPNLSFACKQRGVQMVLVNARLSPRSERRFRKAGAFARSLFSMLDHVFVQEPEDVDRWSHLGLTSDKITYTGSIKFDAGAQSSPDQQIKHFQTLLAAIGWAPQDPVLLAASTHPGEEVALAQVYLKLRLEVPYLRFIMVPRHVERADVLARELFATGCEVQLRSAVEALVGRAATLDREITVPDILLIDTTGELRAWQYLASVVVIGKSFLAKGGQNPTEALMAGRPVVFGPHMENFEPLVSQLLAKQGAVQASDFESLTDALSSLLLDAAKASNVATAGQQVLLAHEGATQRTVAGIKALKKN